MKWGDNIMKMKNEISSGGIVFKKKENKTYWLIVQHSQHKGWIFPKGLVGDGKNQESKEIAALREVNEEGGVKTKIIYKEPIKTQYTYRFKDTLIKKEVYYFLMEYISGDPKDHDWEISNAKFVTKKDVIKTLTYKTDREAFEKAIYIYSSGAGEGN